MAVIALSATPPQAPDTRAGRKTTRSPIVLGILALHAAAVAMSWQAGATAPREPETEPIFIQFVRAEAREPPAEAMAGEPPDHALEPTPPLARRSTPVVPRPISASQPTAPMAQAAPPLPAGAETPTNATANDVPTTASPAQPPISAASPASSPTAPESHAPVELATQLAATCPERPPPGYPALSRQLGEQGQVVLRVELDESGSVSGAEVERSSGYTRLDTAAMAAIRSWHCTAAVRNGQPVKAVARQPFHFGLGN